jgi:chromatin remodeling complex protein RSC6
MANTKKSETTTTPKETKAPKEPKVAKEPKAPKAAKEPKAPKAAAAAPVKEDAVEAAAPVEGADAAVASDVPLASAKIADFGAKLQALSALISTLKGEYKVLEKAYHRELKAAQKGSFRRKRNVGGNRQPSGFVKPTRISDELAVFLGKEKGTEMARTAVSSEINKYIKKHSLQDKANGRMINPDAPLSKLLGVKKDEELTYFNLQKFLKYHFVKATPAPSASA